MKPTPKEVAEKEVNRIIVTKEQAKQRVIDWIDRTLKDVYPKKTIDFWQEVKKEVKNL